MTIDNYLNKIICGDCLEVMKGMPDNSIDTIVTDPPYGLKFMGKAWDHGVPGVEFWKEALRVCKPGAHMLAFGGTRTHHRLMVAIEDAGWEIRDCLGWLYGSGFPKSLDVSKAIDKAAGAERECVGSKDVGPDMRSGHYKAPKGRMVADVTIPNTDVAQHWQGWGTALKPAWEPIILARKPLDGTVAENVQKWGVGALNIDACRVPGKEPHHNYGRTSGESSLVGSGPVSITPSSGRFPANIIHDGNEEVLEVFPETKSGTFNGNRNQDKFRNAYSTFKGTPEKENAYEANEGSAARFFYCAKASSSERGIGNDHPTVKPIDLIRYLVRLITPPYGIVLDLFGGSGTTAVACHEEGAAFVLIEQDPHNIEIAEDRIARATAQLRMFV